MLNNPLYIKSDQETLLPAHCHFGKYMLDCLRNYSDEIALVNSETNKSITYKEFTQYAVDLSYGLHQLGVRRGDVVALGSERRHEFLPTMLAVVMTGATFTSLDYDEGQVPLLQKLNQIKPKYFIHTDLFWQRYGKMIKPLDFIETWISLDDSADTGIPVSTLMETSVDVNLFEPIEVDGKTDVAVAQYTSGTTGTSKVVLSNHINCILMSAKPGLMKDTFKIMSCRATWTSNYDCFFTITFLMFGRTIVYHPEPTYETILNDILKYQVNFAVYEPSFLTLLSKQEDVETTKSLQVFFSAGSALRREVINKIKERYPKLQLLQGYGMTEGNPLSFEKPDFFGNRLGSVGKPCHYTTIKIIDRSSRRVLGPNQQGEIWFRGPVLMKGYSHYKDEILDTEGFFNTGDLGYYDVDHFLFVVNRAKDSIVYDGFEVGVVDLENLLLRHGGVREACVVGAPDAVYGDLPAAFVVAAPGAPAPAPDELRAYVDSLVAPHMRLRGGVRFLDALPKNKRGKILRESLKNLLIHELMTDGIEQRGLGCTDGMATKTRNSQSG
ncbi:hypothetical protein JYU34_004603 [Plutella xylostella]|uniref:Uncharacterized protein n=1 Tax=Plutella xylostella TaxID=51655 RepID=A0ABQ7QYI2_PLUXY|nr:hypothetical protein JYU34_004603 [Plutella xylostella]